MKCFSAPLAAGAAAVLWAAHPNMNAPAEASAIAANTTLNGLTVQAGLYSDFQTDIQTTVSSSQGAPPAGEQFAYTFQVKNSGPYNSVDSVIFIDDFPSGIAWSSATSTRGFCAGITQITCNLGRLAVGEQATITIAVTAPATPQSFTNTGTAVLQSGQTDRAPANNSASITLSIR
jgi:uncharacterized repeat protein (TIGR01451 family)